MNEWMVLVPELNSAARLFIYLLKILEITLEVLSHMHHQIFLSLLDHFHIFSKIQKGFLIHCLHLFLPPHSLSA